MSLSSFNTLSHRTAALLAYALSACAVAMSACGDDAPAQPDITTEPETRDGTTRPEDTGPDVASPDVVHVADTTPDPMEDSGPVEDIQEPPEDGADAEPPPGQAAMPCDSDRPCAEGLVCATLSPSHTVGFCAPTCTTLHATCGFFGPGVYAECVLELPDDTLACAFICVQMHGDHTHDYSCPSGDWGRLRCERSAGAYGHRYCAPSQN